AFLDVDGQTPATALNSLPSSSGAVQNASAGGQAYGPEFVSGRAQFVQFNPDGTINHALTAVTPVSGPAAQPLNGMWGNPVNGHILASSFLLNSGIGLIDIDPLANGGNGSFRVVNTNLELIDGVTGSPDGTIVYSVNIPSNSIIGYDI